MNGRLFSFDVARALAPLLVIAIHLEGGTTMFALSEVGRFAVPLFFAMSGFFFPAPATSGGMSRRLVRLGGIYIFWVLAYLGVQWISGPWEHPRPIRTLIFAGGAGFHLWFISGLFQVMLLFHLLRDRIGISWRWLFGLSALLYALNVVLFTYRLGPADWVSVWVPRYGPAFGLVFFAFGAWLRRDAPSAAPAAKASLWTHPWLWPNPWLWAAIFAAMIAANAAELEFIRMLRISMPFGTPDTRAFTLPLGIAAMMLVYALKDMPAISGPTGRIIARLAGVSLGVYAVHLMFVRWLPEVIPLPPLGIFPIACAMSIISALVLAKTPLRRFVS